MNKPNPAGWRGTPITVGLAVAAIVGAGWVVSQAWTGRELLDEAAKSAAVQAVKMHSAPPIDEVHPSIKSAYVSTEHHMRDMSEVKAAISEQGHRIGRKLDRLDSKLDALVAPSRRGGPRAYTRRSR